jgi:hypothetical protein
VPTKKQLDEAAEAAKRVDWAKIDAMTDEEIEAAARSDPDNPPLTDEELAQMRPVHPRAPRKPSAAE